MTKPKRPPNNSEALRFSKRAQLDKKGAPPDADLLFSKAQQADKEPRRPPATDLAFSKTEQMGKAPGKSQEAGAVKTRRS